VTIKVGKPTIQPDAPAHVSGVKQGNSVGHSKRERGHRPDGKSTARRSTGINPKAHDPMLPTMPNLSPP
jgi:hypothetical protein